MKVYSIFFVLVFLSGCAPTAARTVFYQRNERGEIKSKTLDRLLWENPLPPDENLSSTLILVSDMTSYHLVQVRGSEIPHKHEFHDLVVFIQLGSGKMVSGKENFAVKEGSVVFIPHGVVHQFINGGGEPAVAIAVFSPAYDGKDAVEMPAGGK